MKNPYKDDYSFTPRLSARGRIVDDICYVGDYYILPFDKKQKRKTTWINFGVAFVLLALQILNGCLNQDSSRTAWIVFPYFMIYIPMAYFFMGASTYAQAPVRMQKAHFERGMERMRRSCYGILIFTAISGILDVVYMVLHASQMNAGREILYFVLHLVIIAVVLLFGKSYDRMYGGLHTEASENKLM